MSLSDSPTEPVPEWLSFGRAYWWFLGRLFTRVWMSLVSVAAAILWVTNSASPRAYWWIPVAIPFAAFAVWAILSMIGFVAFIGDVIGNWVVRQIIEKPDPLNRGHQMLNLFFSSVSFLLWVLLVAVWQTPDWR